VISRRQPVGCRAPWSSGRYPDEAKQAEPNVEHGVVVGIALSPLPSPVNARLPLVPPHDAAGETLPDVTALDLMADPNLVLDPCEPTEIELSERDDPPLSMFAGCLGACRRTSEG
jgi:hypothetical protein